MSMLQIGILGVAGVLLALQFKSGKSEYGIYISIVLGLLIFATLLGKIRLIIGKHCGRFLGLHMRPNFLRQYVKMRGIRRLHYRSKCSPRLQSWC